MGSIGIRRRVIFHVDRALNVHELHVAVVQDRVHAVTELSAAPAPAKTSANAAAGAARPQKRLPVSLNVRLPSTECEAARSWVHGENAKAADPGAVDFDPGTL
jgi:hypothetical protein